MPTFILRQIDASLWQAFRDKALQTGQTPKAVILQLIQDYVKGQQ